MPAPTVATYDVSALVAAHTSLRDLIDSGSGPGLIRIRSATDMVLAELVLTDPCGTVNTTTGQLTLTVAADEDAAVAGTAAYGEICTSTGAVKLALPAVAGSSPQAGKIVLNTVTLTAGAPVQLLSATVG